MYPPFMGSSNTEKNRIIRFFVGNPYIPSAPNILLEGLFRYPKPTPKPLAEGIGALGYYQPCGCDIFAVIFCVLS